MKRLTVTHIKEGGPFWLFRDNMTVIPHPKHYNYNLKVRYIAFVTEEGRSWVIHYAYGPYFLAKVGYKEDRLKETFSYSELLAFGVPLTDTKLAAILVPATPEALAWYDPTYHIEHSHFYKEMIAESKLRIRI